jgi:L-serine dehydratase
MLGFEGERPDTVDIETIPLRLQRIGEQGTLNVLSQQTIGFDAKRDLIFNKVDILPLHSNGMRFWAFAADNAILLTGDYYSVGGGFVLCDNEQTGPRIVADTRVLPYEFHSAADLLALCDKHGLTIAQIVRANERTWRRDEDVVKDVFALWSTMKSCVARGCERDGVLPGPLKVRRRAPALLRNLLAKPEAALQDPLTVLDWVNLYALAVNEENAAGGRVVTAPTNGAAGIIPAIGLYFERFCHGGDGDGILTYFLTATAIALLYKENASLSGAEVGCQGEIGVACSMAAGALTAALGGSPSQVENAAEIAMEHHLGLTCDPVGGLVQIPCIERNAMGAVKAINACRIALRGDGKHHVSLDKVIKTMRETGADMSSKYKETSRGGLAVNVIEC